VRKLIFNTVIHNPVIIRSDHFRQRDVLLASSISALAQYERFDSSEKIYRGSYFSAYSNIELSHSISVCRVL